MATWATCSQCGKVEETPTEQIPEGWCETFGELHCPACADVNEDEATSDVVDEEILYPSGPSPADDTLDEFECVVCKGPCQGH